jgi:hypothetical protein
LHFIGNYQQWINRRWLSEILTSPGYGRPRDWQPAFLHEEIEYSKAQEAGYKLNDVHFWLYESSNVTFTVEPPWTKGTVHWWFTKMYPGQFTPMHRDPHTIGENCVRYWVPMQDYAPGHVFVYKDQMITNYKAGDVFQYDDASDTHGAANIGHAVRIILQVTEYL